MTAEEFVLIPKEKYNKTQDNRTQIIRASNLPNKALNLSLLQRIPKEDKKTTAQLKTTGNENEDDKLKISPSILSQLRIMPKAKNEKAKQVLNVISQSNTISIDSENNLMENGQKTNFDVVQFLYDLQQPTKNVEKYRSIIRSLNLEPKLVMNSKAKQILKRTDESKLSPTLLFSDSNYEDVPEEDEEGETPPSSSKRRRKTTTTRKRQKWETFTR